VASRRAATIMNNAGQDYIITGQPTRSCTWEDYRTGFTCNGLGYIHTNEVNTQQLAYSLSVLLVP